MTDKTEEKGGQDRTALLDAYGDYLVARSGGTLQRDRSTLLQLHAFALGVHHFHRGTEPISLRALAEEGDRALSPRPDAADEPLGPSPPDPGAQDESDLAWSRLYDFIVQHFPEERGRVGSVTDSAIRLLGELDEKRRRYGQGGDLGMGISAREDMARIHQAVPRGDLRDQEGTADAVIRLLGELDAARMLARESVALVRDAVLEEREACAARLEIRAGMHRRPPRPPPTPSDPPRPTPADPSSPPPQ